MNQHLLFDAAGIKLAVPASLVRSVHERLPVQDVDGTCDWFLGLALVNGRLLPVTDLGAFCSGRRCTGYTLELDPEVVIAGLKVDGVAGLSDAQSIATSPDSLADVFKTRSLTLTGKSVSCDAEEHLILDVKAFTTSAAFVNIQET